MSLRDGWDARTVSMSECAFWRFLARLDPDDRAWVIERLEDPRQVASDLCVYLHANGLRINQTNLGRHRSGRCECPAEYPGRRPRVLA